MIKGFPGANFFHTAHWARVLAESYGYIPEYAVLKSGAGYVGVVPIMSIRSLWTGKRGVSLPFSDECAPLLARGVNLSALIEPICDLGIHSGWRYLELRGGESTLPGALCSKEFMVHRLTIEASEDLQRRELQDSHRRNIQKSTREGVVVQHLRTREAMEAFYAMHCRTRRRHGLPPQPLRFFRLIHANVIEPGYGFVSLARIEKRWIAGAVFFRFNSQALYKFGASDLRYQHLRPNNLVIWEALNELRKDSVTELSFGRTDLHDAGLLQFKRGWGAMESLLRYYRLCLCSKVAPVAAPGSLSDWGPRVIRATPIPLLRILGALSYRHMG